MLLIVPVSLLGHSGTGQAETGQPGAAILHAQSGVWVNGYEARDSSAVFPGDLLEARIFGDQSRRSDSSNPAGIQCQAASQFAN